MRKPNALLHMTAYGLVYGLLLAMLYIWGIQLFGGGLAADLGWVAYSAYLGFILGALPGAVIGFIEGVILWFVVRGVAVPLDSATFRRLSYRAYGIVGVLTFIGMGLFMGGMFGPWMTLFLFLPIPIATGAALYAVRRYLLKLQVWGGIEKAKVKAKHAEA